MLAGALRETLPGHGTLFPFSQAGLDLTDSRQIKEAVDQCRPDVILNTAAFTRVDDCESQQEKAVQVNGMAVGLLAETARSVGALLVHFSTDYVFDGSKGSPYSEADTPNPLSVYGASKLEGERQILGSGCRYLVIRTQWLYGKGGIHFVRTVQDLAATRPEIRVVNDQIGSPTYVGDLAQATYALLERGGEGVFHVTNGGACSWFEFAKVIINLSGLSVTVSPCSTEAFPRPARRPLYSVLSNEKMRQFLGYCLRPWEEALKDYIGKEISHNQELSKERDEG